MGFDEGGAIFAVCEFYIAGSEVEEVSRVEMIVSDEFLGEEREVW